MESEQVCASVLMAMLGGDVSYIYAFFGYDTSAYYNPTSYCFIAE
jgi:hypothetical protein